MNHTIAPEWAGEHILPDGWENVQVRHLVESMRAGESITAESIESDGDYRVYGGNGVRGYTDSYTHDGEYILVGRQGALCGNVHRVSGSFWASEHAIVATPLVTTDPDWLAYSLRAADLGQYSLTAAQPGIGVAQIASVRLPMPPQDVQRSIVDYLDRETAQIDTLIAKQELLIESLHERRNTLIDRSVFGLDLRAEISDTSSTTGVHLAVKPMLERMPADWRVTRFKNALVRRDERNHDLSQPMMSLRSNGEIVPRASTGERQEPDEKSLPRYLVARKDDLVVNPMWLIGGAIGVSQVDGAVSPDYRVFRSRGHHVPRYLHHLLRSRPYRDQYVLYTRAQTTFDRRVQQPDLDNLPVVVPPIDVQQAIARSIDEQDARVNALIDRARRFIELARERRAALITAAVTGQIDVREQVA